MIFYVCVFVDNNESMIFIVAGFDFNQFQFNCSIDTVYFESITRQSPLIIAEAFTRKILGLILSERDHEKSELSRVFLLKTRCIQFSCENHIFSNFFVLYVFYNQGCTNCKLKTIFTN